MQILVPATLDRRILKGRFKNVQYRHDLTSMSTYTTWSCCNKVLQDAVGTARYYVVEIDKTYVWWTRLLAGMIDWWCSWSSNRWWWVLGLVYHDECGWSCIMAGKFSFGPFARCRQAFWQGSRQEIMPWKSIIVSVVACGDTPQRVKLEKPAAESSKPRSITWLRWVTRRGSVPVRPLTCY